MAGLLAPVIYLEGAALLAGGLSYSPGAASYFALSANAPWVLSTGARATTPLGWGTLNGAYAVAETGDPFAFGPGFIKGYTSAPTGAIPGPAFGNNWRPLTNGAPAGSGGLVFYGTPSGQLIEAPPGYYATTAVNGRGLVLLPEGQPLGNNLNIIRYGDPTAIFPTAIFGITTVLCRMVKHWCRQLDCRVQTQPHIFLRLIKVN